MGNNGQGLLPLTFKNTVSPQRAAQMLGISRRKVHELIDEGHLRAYRFPGGSRWYVDYQSVVDLANRVVNEPAN